MTITKRRREEYDKGHRSNSLSVIKKLPLKLSQSARLVSSKTRSSHHHTHHSSSASNFRYLLSGHEDNITDIDDNWNAHIKAYNSSTALSIRTQALQTLLQHPIRFVSATQRTFDDESKMSPIPQAKKVRSESIEQRAHRLLTHHLSADWHRQALRPTSSRGLVNPNNLCYQNSLLQSMLHIPKFVNWLELHHDKCGIKDCLACCFKAVCQSYWNEPYHEKSITDAIKVLRSRLARAGDFIRIKWAWQKQQDVSEFYLQLLPAILQGNTPITATVKGLFEFDLTASLKCPRCKDITSQTNPQYNLDIHVNIGDHLSNILRETTFRGSVIHGRRCSRCKNTSNVRQPYRLVNGPEILILNMLRFTNKLYKNMSRVSFTQDLDLTEYTMPRTELKYRLVAVIQQKGTLHSGHYKAVAQCPGGKWQDLNDSSVTTVGINDALNPGGGWTPYMLFWTRSDKSKPVQRL